MRILLVLSLLFLASCSSVFSDKKFEVPETPLAKGYTVIKKTGLPTSSGNFQYRIIIQSDTAHTFEERAQTAMQAVARFQESFKADDIQVWMEASPTLSENIAVAEYFPYGVNASGDEQAYSLKVVASDVAISESNGKQLAINLKKYFEK